ncbi:MAG: hypothetical protein D6E12_16590 [Desulfovibrio sp.]|nr:MAG: hypothetical protein D6E12_16590 [Desulfovibrio sp.]
MHTEHMHATICKVLNSGDIPEALAQLGPVNVFETQEKIFLHTHHQVLLDGFSVTLVVSREVFDDGPSEYMDLMLEVRALDTAMPLFPTVNEARAWAEPFGQITINEAEYLDVSGEPNPGLGSPDPVWW